MDDNSTLKPFHESIVDSIQQVSSHDDMTTLGSLIKGTKIPKGHDAIVEAWNKMIGATGVNDDCDGVVESILAQKPTETADA